MKVDFLSEKFRKMNKLVETKIRRISCSEIAETTQSTILTLSFKWGDTLLKIAALERIYFFS